MYKTSDGIEIIVGMTVYTNEVRVGVVHTAPDESGWFDVRYADESRCLQNGERVSARCPAWFPSDAEIEIPPRIYGRHLNRSQESGR